jgi:hypothetical protein
MEKRTEPNAHPAAYREPDRYTASDGSVDNNALVSSATPAPGPRNVALPVRMRPPGVDAKSVS